MKEIYWLNVIGNIGEIACAIAIICGILLIVALVPYFLEYEEDARMTIKRVIRKIFFTFGVSRVIAIFVPDTKTLYALYGIGGTIDYIKSNETAKQLPDKVVNALDKWVDSINEENTTSKNEGE